MTFQPIVASAGIAGWRFLERTYDSQFDAFKSSREIERDTDYFKANIAKITSAEDLVADRRLLSVALGAFGLKDDLNNRFFIQKVLEDGTANTDALANRLSDSRYTKLSDAFGFGPLNFPRTGTDGFADTIIEKFQAQEFEIAVGTQDETMRIGLYAQRELGEIASGEGEESTKWFKIMGLPPLRAMFETAFGLPSSFGQIDLDQQLGVFEDKAEQIFGSSDVAQFANPEVQEKLLTTYIARAQIASFGAGASSTAIALQLLQNG